ncbi:hypothetical protein EJ06DRAFT_522628 [Trichodelitschia bisporula]|uniref:Uncharacterized protein n=1 Tax=Trichodelitschia bisporula TaxID=703511 RepID=A0A6G1HSM2_9PEZI|nr:hypothetical protein EJ06DRAFT_522628 [Trichodelitschia bisporula]
MSPHTELALGTLRIISTHSALRLSSSTSIVISCPDGSAPSDPSSLEQHWLRRGPGLCLDIEISVDGTPLSEHVRSGLGDVVCNAELWKQLCLRVTPQAQTDTSVAAAENHILLGINHIPDSLAMHKRRHRLPLGASAADVMPPETIQVVDVRMKAIGRSLGKRRKKDDHQIEDHAYVYAPKRLKEKPDSGDEDMWQMYEVPLENRDFDDLDSDENLFDSQTMSDGVLLSSQSTECGELSPESEVRNEWISNERMLPDLPDATYRAPWNNDARLSAATRPFHESALPIPQRSRSLQDKGETFPVKIPILTSLLDAAIRLTIHAKPRNLAPSLKTKPPEPGYRLASIVPALLCPGYLHAVATRSPFVPTIAQALVHRLPTRVKSTSLKVKLDQLLGTDGGLQDASKRFAIAERAVWRVAQKGLLDPGAARRLAPLSSDGKKRDADQIRDEGEDEDGLFRLGLDLQDDNEAEDDMFMGDEDELLFDLDDEAAIWDDDFAAQVDGYGIYDLFKESQDLFMDDGDQCKEDELKTESDLFAEEQNYTNGENKLTSDWDHGFDDDEMYFDDYELQSRQDGTC